MKPGLADLFFGFLAISLRGFGGVLPWARRVLVEERKWLAEDEFNDMLALCQFLPGPNIGNLSAAVGARFHGAAGACAALSGLLAVPALLVLLCAAFYPRFAHCQIWRHVFAGMAAAGAGLLLAMTARMAVSLLKVRPLAALPIMILAFAGVAFFHFPLPSVILLLLPLSVIMSRRAA